MCLGIPGQIVKMVNDDPLTRSAIVSFAGAHKEINLACVPEAGVGDFVIVHVGIAINRIDEEQATAVFDLLQQIDSKVL